MLRRVIGWCALLVAAPAAADRVGDLRAACEATTDDARREAALGRILTVEAAAATLRLDGGTHLAFDFSPRVIAEGGAVTLDGGDEPATATVKPALAGAVMRAHDQGRLVARIAFRLAEAERLDRPCTAVGGGRFMRVRIAPLWVDLVADTALARLLTARGALEPAAGATLEVELATPTVAGLSGRDAYLVAEAALPLREVARGCYRTGARERPPRTGTVALSLTVGGSGVVDEVIELIDGLRDDAVRACLDDGARALHFPRTRHGAHVTASLTFHLAPAKP